MQKLKFIKLITPLFIGTLCIPIIASCSNSNYISNKDSNQFDDNTNNNELFFINYFDSKNKPTKVKQIEIKKKINNTIKDYRLDEWNYYYNQSNNKLTKSKVLNLSWIDYKKINVKKEQINTNLFKDLSEIEWTKTYADQDVQFRYFNDFINIINNEDDKNQEDFLYLRWVFYSIDAAIKYHTIKAVNKPIYEINISDWSKAIVKAIIPIKPDPKDLLEIIKAFLNYYGIDLKNNQVDFGIIENSIIHLMLVSKDLLMRASCKNNNEINKYQLWKKKILRIKKMYQITQEKYQLLANSLSGNFEIDDKDLPQDVDVDSIKNNAASIFNIIKEQLMVIIDETLANLVKIDFNDYCDIRLG